VEALVVGLILFVRPHLGRRIADLAAGSRRMKPSR
jgi:hypothetical protein